MKATTRFALPYPEDKDAPDGPSQLQELAEAVEKQLGYAGAAGGAKLIEAEQSRESASYGVLGTADEVKSIVVPEKGLIHIAAIGIMKSSVSGAGRAAIFIGTKQLVVNSLGGTPQNQSASSKATYKTVFCTSPGGLIATTEGESSEISTERGQAIGGVGVESNTEGTAFVGGICSVFAPAGTYDVSLRFAATSGKVTVEKRRLYVWTQEFA